MYKVGESFPQPNILPGAERCIASLNTAFFDVLYYIQKPSSEDIRTWRKGKLKYGLYAEKSVPFVIIDFPDARWNFDVSIDILKVYSEEQREDWLNGEGNIVTLFLINAGTNILEGMRTISVNFGEKLRDILEEQCILYESSAEVDKEFNDIVSRLTTDNMMSRCVMTRL